MLPFPPLSRFPILHRFTLDLPGVLVAAVAAAAAVAAVAAAAAAALPTPLPNDFARLA